MHVTFFSKTGNGKSKLGTLLLRALGSQEVFVSYTQTDSGTKKPRPVYVDYTGRSVEGKLLIIDVSFGI